MNARYRAITADLLGTRLGRARIILEGREAKNTSFGKALEESLADALLMLGRGSRTRITEIKRVLTTEDSTERKKFIDGVRSAYTAQVTKIEDLDLDIAAAYARKMIQTN